MLHDILKRLDHDRLKAEISLMLDDMEPYFAGGNALVETSQPLKNLIRVINKHYKGGAATMGIVMTLVLLNRGNEQWIKNLLAGLDHNHSLEWSRQATHNPVSFYEAMTDFTKSSAFSFEEDYIAEMAFNNTANFTVGAYILLEVLRRLEDVVVS